MEDGEVGELMARAVARALLWVASCKKLMDIEEDVKGLMYEMVYLMLAS